MLNVFTIYETLFENLITILHITFQRKTKIPEKQEVPVSTIYKLFEYNFLVEQFRV